MKYGKLPGAVASLALITAIGFTGTSPASATETVPADPAKIAEIIGKDGASMGQGLTRLKATGDAQNESLDAGSSQMAQIQSTPVTEAGTWRPAGIQGMDVSSHQGNVNWPGAWTQGSRFAYVKATEALSYKNPYFNQQYLGSQSVGMVRGAYHFAIPSISSGAAQANYFVANGGGWSADGKTMPPLLDIEYNPYSELGNTCYNMSAAQMVSWIRDFSNTMKAKTGRVPMIYTTTDWWSRCTGNSAAFADHPLHIASYNNVGAGTLPASWKYYSVWQYSSTGPFVGDSNVWNGSATGLVNFARNSASGASQPAPTPTPVPTTPTPAPAPALVKVTPAGPSSNIMMKTYTIPAKTGVSYAVNGAAKAAGTYPGTGTVSIKATASQGYVLSGTSSWTYAFQSTPLVATGDMIASDASGVLWNYGHPSTSGRKMLAPSGWASAKEIFVTDWNSDGVQDILAQWNSGALSLYTGNANGSFSAGKTIGAGWGSYTVSVAKWKKTDKYPSIIARDSLGKLWNYQNLYGNGVQARVLVGSGWNGLDFNLIDWDKDGGIDVLAKNSKGQVLLYRTDGAGKFRSETRKVIGAGWGSYRMQSSVSYTGAGSQGILATDANGGLYYYGTGNGYWTPRVYKGAGWLPMKISG